MSNSPPSSLFRRHRLSQASSDGMIIVCQCSLCRHREVYVPGDLVVVHGDMAVEDFGRGGCAKCGRVGFVRSRAYYPKPEDVGRVELIRPDGWQQVWNWRREWLDLPIRPIDETGHTAPDARLPGLWGG